MDTMLADELLWLLRCRTLWLGVGMLLTFLFNDGLLLFFIAFLQIEIFQFIKLMPLDEVDKTIRLPLPEAIL